MHVKNGWRKKNQVVITFDNKRRLIKSMNKALKDNCSSNKRIGTFEGYDKNGGDVIIKLDLDSEFFKSVINDLEQELEKEEDGGGNNNSN